METALFDFALAVPFVFVVGGLLMLAMSTMFGRKLASTTAPTASRQTSV
jgi:hypothetical protein